MATYSTFTSQSDADTAADKIWYNFLMATANNSEKIVGDGTTHYFLSDLQGMTEAQVTALKLYGKKNGVIQYDSGLTTKYVNPHQCDNDANKFVFLKPDSSLMTGVVNDTDEEKNKFWWKNSWDASTNTPTLADGVGTSGDKYYVEVAGTQDLGSGDITFAVDDTVEYNGSVWQKGA